MVTNKVGDFGGTEGYLNHDGIANVLLLYHLGCKYPITYNSQDPGGVFIVTTPCGVIEFRPTNNGLHYVDLNTNPEAAVLLVNSSQSQPPWPSMVQLVRGLLVESWVRDSNPSWGG